ncbi:MAG: tetratricopeptide repeat protein [Fimbriimonadaceae bacterium]|nr:tetratricopeptide repeat protein [Chthonomonadaceae bacterium]MCO5296093.1 tetratricopeptide repeat protein [Fimbriimonadaceae bacterium]
MKPLRRLTIRALVGTLAALTLIQPAGAQLDPTRMRVIDGAIHDRLSTQGDVWFEAGDYLKSIQSLRAAQSLDPADYEIATDLGWMLENVLAWDEALATYVRYRKSNPNDPDAAYPEANFYFMKKSYLEIPALLEPMLKMARPPHANTFRILAHAYDRLGLFADSKRVWDQLLAVDPNDEAAKVNLKKVEAKLKGGTSK